MTTQAKTRKPAKRKAQPAKRRVAFYFPAQHLHVNLDQVVWFQHVGDDALRVCLCRPLPETIGCVLHVADSTVIKKFLKCWPG